MTFPVPEWAVPDWAMPEPDSDTAPFWAATGRHELSVQRCDECGRHVFYPRVLCPFCASTGLRWVTCTGGGTVFSYTVAHQGWGEFADQAPFVVALVELDEGVRMMTRIVGVDPTDVRIGQPVRVAFQDVADGLALPCFTPA